MTDMIPIEDYFKSLNANKILIGILSQIKEISIPVKFFSDIPDTQLAVTINEDGTEFIFKLKEDNGDE